MRVNKSTGLETRSDKIRNLKGSLLSTESVAHPGLSYKCLNWSVMPVIGCPDNRNSRPAV